MSLLQVKVRIRF